MASKRHQLEAALEWVREGDKLVVTKLDRLARSVADLVAMTEALKRKKVELQILSMNLDTSTPTGKLMLNLLGADRRVRARADAGEAAGGDCEG